MKIICDICSNAEMDIIKTIGTKESGKRYRQRWFICPICGMKKKITGSGYNSEVLVPLKIKKQLKDTDK
jgi:hypothetical protein